MNSIRLDHPAITPKILQQIARQLAPSSLATVALSSSFGRDLIEAVRGEDLEKYRRAMYAEEQVRQEIQPPFGTLSKTLLENIVEALTFQKKLYKRELVNGRRASNDPAIEFYEKHLEKIEGTVRLMEEVIANWQLLHGQEELSGKPVSGSIATTRFGRPVRRALAVDCEDD